MTASLAARRSFVHPSALPGFGIAFGYTVVYLGLIVLIPLAVLALRASNLGLGGIWAVATDDRVFAALRVTFGISFAAALVNVVFGVLVAWVLTRYDFLAPLGIKVAFTPLGIAVALVFIGLPFVVRTLQPVLEELDKEIEEASATLGATRRQTLWRVVLPPLLPAVLTGFALSFARAIGEYGSVIFIAGNIPYVSEIAPLLIVQKLEENDYAGATAIAAIMLVISFAVLLVINLLQSLSRRRSGHV
jgi:sulfate transport system permease protein